MLGYVVEERHRERFEKMRQTRRSWRAELLIVSAVVVLAGLWTIHAQQQPGSNFTGGKVTRLEETPPGQIGYFHFDAGARTKWHVHEKGQLVFVEEGVGLAQEKRGPIVEIHAAEAIWCPPGVTHWHGAAPDKGGTQYNVTRGAIKWLDEVTDQEYKAKTVRK
jgi:quercetin dioxygenase-like cupin family protein